jgi:hypothetical protein
MSRLALPLVLLALASCGSDGGLGPPDSYRLLAPVKDAASKGGLPVMKAVALDDPAAVPLARLFEEGFASEMLRTVYLAKQLVRDGQLGGHPATPEGRAFCSEGLPVVLGLPQAVYGRGLAVDRSLRAPVDHPAVPWIGLGDLDRDRALVQTVSGKLATYALHLVLTGGTFSQPQAALPTALGEGYRMAMEVVAREWRVGKGPQGVVPYDAGTPAQRTVFADVRENRFVTGADHRTLRPPLELLADPGVAATVIYRLAQSRAIAGRAAPLPFYQPFAAGRLPPGVSPAAVLGPLRNFQAKLLAAWADAAQRGHAPRDIAELVEVYAAAFPEEKTEVLRVFVVTTFAATVQPGGVSTRPEDASKALAAIDAVVSDVAAGRRSLRAVAK